MKNPSELNQQELLGKIQDFASEVLSYSEELEKQVLSPLLTPAIVGELEKAFLSMTLYGYKRADLTDVFGEIKTELIRLIESRTIGQDEFGDMLDKHQPFPPEPKPKQCQSGDCRKNAIVKLSYCGDYKGPPQCYCKEHANENSRHYNRFEFID